MTQMATPGTVLVGAVPVGSKYQWYRNGQKLFFGVTFNANTTSYALGSSDVGSVIFLITWIPNGMAPVSTDPVVVMTAAPHVGGQLNLSDPINSGQFGQIGL